MVSPTGADVVGAALVGIVHHTGARSPRHGQVPTPIPGTWRFARKRGVLAGAIAIVTVAAALAALFGAPDQGGSNKPPLLTKLARPTLRQTSTAAVSSPIDLGPSGDQVYVVLAATGLGGTPSTTATIGGADAQVVGAGDDVEEVLDDAVGDE